MRLWHYELIPVLPNAMLVSQWRECIAIKRQWEKGTLKHKLVSYVMNYSKRCLVNYTIMVAREMNNRGIQYQEKYLDEMYDFCICSKGTAYDMYKEHNDRYFTQCYYNLEEKHDRGIISDEEWSKIYNIWPHYTVEG